MEMKIENVQNAQVRVSTDLKGFKINALVQLDSQKNVQNINDGYVIDESSLNQATFSSYQPEQANINFNNLSNAAEATQVIKEFCNYLRNNVDKLEIVF